MGALDDCINKSPHSLNQVVGVAYLWTSYGLGTSIGIALFYSFYIKNYLLSYKSHLGKYEKVSGQKINSNKTTLFFNKIVYDITKELLKNLLGVLEIKEYEKYLGLPVVVERRKKVSLNYIKDRVWGKLQGWKEKLLSQVENEVLLKTMVQVIPTFAMSCFKLPIGLFQDIEMLFQKIWWDQRGERRKIH